MITCECDSQNRVVLRDDDKVVLQLDSEEAVKLGVSLMHEGTKALKAAGLVHEED